MYGYTESGLVSGTLTEEGIILDRGDEVLIIDEERLCSSQVSKIDGGRFLWGVVSHTALSSFGRCDLFANVIDEPDTLVKVESWRKLSQVQLNPRKEFGWGGITLPSLLETRSK